MYKCDLPFIFQRNLLSSDYKNTNKFKSPNCISELRSMNGKDTKTSTFKKYLLGTHITNFNSKTSNQKNEKDMDKDKVKDQDKNSNLAYMTINIIIPKKKSSQIIERKKQPPSNEDSLNNNMFLTRCHIIGNETKDETKWNYTRHNMSDIEMLLRQLEINKEKIDNERDDLQKMIKKTKHTHQRICGLTRDGFKFHYKNLKIKKKF